jgi:phosphoribosylglycinamide formyltransferase-1
LALKKTATRKKILSVAVFCSGQGTNLQAILDACRRKKISARVTVMITDNASAFAISRAKKAGVPVVFVEPAGCPSRSAYGKALAAATARFKPDLIALAGFMRILSPGFVRKYKGKIINIHPALLPAFPGAHAVRDALAAGVKTTGVTVHFVDEKVDHGPVISQKQVPIKKSDTEATLLQRLHRVEHQLYPEVIQRIADRP